ncbi:MAG TPA: DUF1501 domain-containing protein [Gemmataceae bacterium]|nr:DUF1501 domain-containing protein [Gemmataceae bacterium]
MLTVLGHPQQICTGWTRRQLLQVGGAGLFGLSLPRVLAAETAQPAPKARAKSVMFLYLFGGPSQLDTFDMKPDAPSGIRGPFRPIASRTPGLRICEHLPRLAQASDQFCVIRSMTHRHNDHNACHYIQTGHPFPRVAASGNDVNATDKDWPAIGSVLEYLDQRQPGRRRDFPSYVYLPNRLGHLQGYDRTGQYGGWLGRAYNALATDIQKRAAHDNPYFRPCTDDELDFRIKGLATDAALTLDRLDRRRGLLEQFETQRREFSNGKTATHDRIRQRALDLVLSEKIRTALDIRREPSRLRDQYGRHLFGQATLMGRRMIEAGARFVTVAWDAPDGYSWDSHRDSQDVKKHLLPGLDQALSALLGDLKDRGLLDETLVVCLGEMGRTPKGNARWGRDHWSYCFPVLLAGAGVRGGIVYGRSDKDAGYPVEQPVSPEDIACTIFDALGIDPHGFIYDKQNRPVGLMDGGRPLRDLFA